MISCFNNIGRRKYFKIDLQVTETNEWAKRERYTPEQWGDKNFFPKKKMFVCDYIWMAQIGRLQMYEGKHMGNAETMFCSMFNISTAC